ncbi:MAG TPA: hypothetical protein PLL71_07230 [Agriterribacter sp.]|nr:hypothetical protein [Agriterribacter sp.]HRQ51019.1 hypothetical protein [Agriterribacter sp.]
MKHSFLCLVLLLAGISHNALAQTKTEQPGSPLQVGGYFGVLHPVATLQSGAVKMNFDNSYTVGFVAGINIQKNLKYGYTFEIIPVIEATSQTSKVKSLVFQPGIYFPLKKGWRMINRFSFETTGRYGITPAVSKTLLRRNHPVALIVPIPLRFGNAQDFSAGAAILVTIGM